MNSLGEKKLEISLWKLLPWECMYNMTRTTYFQHTLKLHLHFFFNKQRFFQLHYILPQTCVCVCVFICVHIFCGKLKNNFQLKFKWKLSFKWITWKANII